MEIFNVHQFNNSFAVHASTNPSLMSLNAASRRLAAWRWKLQFNRARVRVDQTNTTHSIDAHLLSQRFKIRIPRRKRHAQRNGNEVVAVARARRQLLGASRARRQTSKCGDYFTSRRADWQLHQST